MNIIFSLSIVYYKRARGLQGTCLNLRLALAVLEWHILKWSCWCLFLVKAMPFTVRILKGLSLLKSHLVYFCKLDCFGNANKCNLLVIWSSNKQHETSWRTYLPQHYFWLWVRAFFFFFFLFMIQFVSLEGSFKSITSG